MPYKPKKPCSFPGCPELTDERFCTAHKKQDQKQYNGQRGSSAQRGYSARWRRYRIRYLMQHPLCINFDECHNPAMVVDHILPVSRGGSFRAQIALF